jgi:hypothetical protein
MENKYYTPELEEFHVGFEYEVMIPEKNLWSNEIFHLNDSHINLIKYVKLQDEFTKNKIRVKHLDIEDIDSLGWDCDLNSTGRYEYKDYMLYNFNNSNTFTIKAKRGFVKYGQAFVGFDVLFEGIIKNKSELKKLMKQLNIL